MNPAVITLACAGCAGSTQPDDPKTYGGWHCGTETGNGVTFGVTGGGAGVGGGGGGGGGCFGAGGVRSCGQTQICLFVSKTRPGGQFGLFAPPVGRHRLKIGSRAAPTGQSSAGGSPSPLMCAVRG